MSRKARAEVEGGLYHVITRGNNRGDIYYTYANNQRSGFGYDASGNLTNDLGQTFTYDATGQQAAATYSGYSLQQNYDGNGLRVKKNDNGAITYYVRSTVLGGQVVAELNASGVVKRTYTYLGGQLLSLRNTSEKGSGAYWIHEDPITKSKRVTNSLGTVVSTVELDPWGADTPRSNNAAFQPRKFTSYDRDGNGSDEAMFRRSNRWHSRFDQPDPYDGSYSLTNPQSFNRYAYVQGDPVNFVDPTGLRECQPGDYHPECDSSGFGGWGGGFNMNDHGHPGRDIIAAAEKRYNRFAYNALPFDESVAGLPEDFQFFSLWNGFWGQKRGWYKPDTRGEHDNGLGNCLRAQFAAAKLAGEKYAAENALSLKPSASTVVVVTGVFVSAMVFTKQPVLSGLAAGAVGIAKDVVGDNVVRITKRIASSVSNEADLNLKLGNCYRERGQEPPGEFLPDALRVAYGNQ